MARFFVSQLLLDSREVPIIYNMPLAAMVAHKGNTPPNAERRPLIHSALQDTLVTPEMEQRH